MLIVLRGEYDIARRAELRSHLGSGTAQSLVLLDVRGVTFIDATAVGEIIDLQRRMIGPAVVRIVGATPHVNKVLHVTGASDVLELHDSFASACRGFLSLAPSR